MSEFWSLIGSLASLRHNKSGTLYKPRIASINCTIFDSTAYKLVLCLQMFLFSSVLNDVILIYESALETRYRSALEAFDYFFFCRKCNSNKNKLSIGAEQLTIQETYNQTNKRINRKTDMHKNREKVYNLVHQQFFIIARKLLRQKLQE